jgi:hypothetical protein
MTHAQAGKWLAALKSGKYNQCQTTLYVRDNDTREIVSYCCLGVYSKEFHMLTEDDSSLSDSYPNPYSIPLHVQFILMDLNDKGEIDQYQRVIQDIELALEDYITA